MLLRGAVEITQKRKGRSQMKVSIILSLFVTALFAAASVITPIVEIYLSN
jgi:hypothetical protein